LVTFLFPFVTGITGIWKKEQTLSRSNITSEKDGLAVEKKNRQKTRA